MLGYLLSPVLQIEDTNGLPLVNGKVYVYEANTSNLATIYSNYEGTYNTNPAILDLAGHTTIIADDSILYDITIKDADDNLLFSAEDIAVGGEGGSAIVTDVSVQAGNNGITVSQSVVNQTKVFKVYIDYNFVASQSDLALKQDKLSAGPNIDITNNVVSGKDWQDEIDDAVAAVATGFIPYSATNIPAGSSVSVYGDNMLLVGKNITGYAYGNLAVGENIDKMAPNGLIAGSGINGFQNNILVGNNVSAGGGPDVVIVGDSISAALCSLIIGGPSITGAYGESTIVVGNNNLTGMGNHNVVLGHANTAISGRDNVIIGRGNSTTGSENIVIGIDNSSNSGTIFGGIYNQVNNFGYVFGGSYNTATSAAAVLNGDGCYASGTGSVAEGGYTSAIGNCSHAEGYGTIAAGDYQTVVGQYNISNTADVFQIGAGSTDDNRLNALTVDNSGNVFAYAASNSGLKANVSANLIGMPVFTNMANIPVDGFTGSDQIKHIRKSVYCQAYTADQSNKIQLLDTNGGVPTPIRLYPCSAEGKYKVDMSITIKGGYYYNGGTNRNTPQFITITPEFTYTGTYGYMDMYKGYPYNTSENTPLNHYYWSFYLTNPGGYPANDWVELTSLNAYVENMRWNTSEYGSACVNIRCVKLSDNDEI